MDIKRFWKNFSVRSFLKIALPIFVTVIVLFLNGQNSLYLGIINFMSYKRLRAVRLCLLPSGEQIPILEEDSRYIATASAGMRRYEKGKIL